MNQSTEKNEESIYTGDCIIMNAFANHSATISKMAYLMIIVRLIMRCGDVYSVIVDNADF